MTPCENEVELPDGFCIDGEEVTRRSYRAWLDREPSPLRTIPGCASNVSLEPECEWHGFETGEDWAVRAPATCIDWCDAAAYCAALDRYLCGSIGGGAAPFESFGDVHQNQWLSACSAGGEDAYPYGDEFVSGFCVDASVGELTRIDSKAACRSIAFPYSCIVDLSGNIAEWENSCDSDAEDANCRVRGGTYLDDGEALSCAAAATRPRNATDNAIGFRCCSDRCDD